MNAKRHSRALRLAAAALPGLLLLAGCASTALDDSRIGLRQAGVFEVVPPVPFAFADERAPTAPRPGSGEPPMIGHTVDDYLPITARANECLDCHDKPATIGRPVAVGKARPAPASHYRGLPAAPALAGSHHACMACHAPQAGVPPLVGQAR